tara:strand:- start:8745 stop:8978 length:234 start_codon:yes stop_codon:yes gene_type:complete
MKHIDKLLLTSIMQNALDLENLDQNRARIKSIIVSCWIILEELRTSSDLIDFVHNELGDEYSVQLAELLKELENENQ